MTTPGILQYLFLFVLVLVLTRPVGLYMARVYAGERTFLSPLFKPIESLFYKLFGVKEEEDMHWMTYTLSMLAFTLVGGLATYAMLRLQGSFPLNPKHFSGSDMTPDLAFNTAASFSTNTNWQAYSPEGTVSYFSNMVALASQNWMSAAAGMAIGIAVIRGFARHKASGLGNFWVDLTRSILYILLPICLVYAVALVQQGVPQNFSAYTDVKTLEGASQSIAQGPVASQEAIKLLGTNGGGFFNANSAHPYENPTPLANFLELLSILVIGAGFTYTFGKTVGKPRQGWAIFAAMSILFLWSPLTAYWAEARGVPQVEKMAVMTQPTQGQPGGNMEGKETRFGLAASTLFAATTTDTSCGAVNSMHDSYTPIGGMVPLLNIMCDEVIFGGVGCGLYGMMMYVVVAVFLAGLMIGRTPEYLGKKIEKAEVRLAALAILILFACNVFFAALAGNATIPPGANSATFTTSKDDAAKEAALPPSAQWNHVNNSSPSNYEGATWNNVNNNGAHGFSEILYGYAEATGNNGSAFAGLTANTPFYNLTIGLAVLVGRLIMLIPIMAMAGSLARKREIPVSAGTLATDTPTFVLMIAGVVLLVGVIEYSPALALGPIVEHLQMIAGKTF